MFRWSVQFSNPLAFNGTRTVVVNASSVVEVMSMARREGIQLNLIVGIVRLGAK